MLHKSSRVLSSFHPIVRNPTLSLLTVRAAPLVLVFGKSSFTCNVLPARTYATKRGASNRPVKEKERADHGHNALASHQTEGPISDQQQAQPPYQAYDYTSQYGGQTASQVIESSTSLRAFLRRSMLTTAAGVGISAGVCAVAMQIPLLVTTPWLCIGVGLVGAIGSLIGMNATPPTFVQEGEIVKAEYSTTRKALFGTFLVAEGICMVPLLKMASVVAPMAIPVAGCLAAATMSGMALYALNQPQGSLQKWGPALSVGLLGLIGVSLVNMFVGSSVLMMATSAAGIGLFAAFTAFDTHIAIQEHNEGRPDHMMTAVNFYLNFVNLFQDFLRLLMAFFND